MSSGVPTTTSTRRMKWNQAAPPPPTPKIIHLPRRPRRKSPKTAAKKPPSSSSSSAAHKWRRHSLNPMELLHEEYYYKGKLERLFGQEREFSRAGVVPIVVLNSAASCGDSDRRERVEEDGGEAAAAAFAEEKWRFQAEMLRAECNFLRMEREFALKKLERNRVQMETTLRSAGKKKIYEGKNGNAILEEEIEDLEEKLDELKRSSKKNNRDFEITKCSSNFDKQASLLQRRLEKLGGLSDQKFPEIEASGCKTIKKSTDVELLRRMEGLSKCMLDRMEEEYGAIISSTTANVSTATSTSKQMEFSDPLAFSTRQLHQEEENRCSGRCKAIVRRIVEQVKAETEQWSQMQEMLGQVREEMQELQASRDFWEDRALESAREIQSLQSTVQEWKETALSSEVKVKELQMQLSAAKESVEKLRAKQGNGQTREAKSTPNSPKAPLGKQIEKEKRVGKENQGVDDDRRGKTIGERSLEVAPISLAKQIEKEKRMLLRRLKDNIRGNNEKIEVSPSERRKAQTHNDPKRSPFRDVANSSPLVRQNSKAVFPWHSPEHCI
ncbi:PREDICTED: myosin heavy chain, clone 203 isoform X2 [Ipomoea nil]|uniref:myosin heavy chain, clone 203 isoform X2 n=1 Tax=Ipomoea nil TaxID=35883 RepID=UPI000901F24C|nr:PREDICTED: myosin heavy chain, clone 203 isoform X2 [Ipomoea nil]